MIKCMLMYNKIWGFFSNGKNVNNGTIFIIIEKTGFTRIVMISKVVPVLPSESMHRTVS